MIWFKILPRLLKCLIWFKKPKYSWFSISIPNQLFCSLYSYFKNLQILEYFLDLSPLHQISIEVKKVLEDDFVCVDGVVLVRRQSRGVQRPLNHLTIVLVLREQFDQAEKGTQKSQYRITNVKGLNSPILP